jgi:hypothetical protein
VKLDVPTAAPEPQPVVTAVAGPATPTTTTAIAGEGAGEGAPTKRKVPWVGVAVTGAFAAGAIVTGVLALSASNRLKNDRETLGTSRSTLDGDQTSVKRWSITSDVLLAGAAVAGAITLVVWLKKPSDDAPKSGATSVNVGFAPNGVVLAGSF